MAGFGELANVANPLTAELGADLASPSMYRFHYHLFNQLTNSGNGAFSPYVLDLVMCMLFFGTAGSSFAQLQKLFFGNRTPQESATVLDVKGLTGLAASENDAVADQGEEDLSSSVVLEKATRMYLDKRLSFENFRDILQEQFEAVCVSADFLGGPAKEEEAINDWVAMKTRDKISKLLPEGVIKSSTRLLLVAALYFKGEWLKPFEPVPVALPFYANELSKKSTPPSAEGKEMVTVTRNIKYMEISSSCNRKFCFGYYDSLHLASEGQQDDIRPQTGDGIQVLELPYKGENYSMIIIMPDDPSSLPRWEKHWAQNPEDVETLISKMYSPESRDRILNGSNHVIRIPYFKITPETVGMPSDASEVLRAMGITDIFDARKCDLTNMDKAAENLMVGGIFQACSVEVDEKGTVAAAAAAVQVALRCALPSAPGVYVVIDRPFLFQIRYNRDNLKSKTAVKEDPAARDVVLFFGRVVDPMSLQAGETPI